MNWHEDRALKEEPLNDASRILTVTSGNVQPFSNEVNEDFVDRSPSALQNPNLSDFTKQSFPAPATTLRSNDYEAQIQQTLRLRKIRLRYARAKRCWEHPPYQKYLTRARKDINKKTKEVVWDEDIERAFRNAVVNIPAMGRSKKSQHGKACGRNELFAEWLVQETGKERTRKQISSHLQVFDAIFKDIPEWFRLNKIPKTGSVDDMAIEDDEYEYYKNSIADMVRYWKTVRDISPDGVEVGSELTPGILLLDPLPVLGVDFDMWVSQPDDISRVLHRYTKMQHNQPLTPSEPLENVPDWRTRWPDLVPIIDKAYAGDRLDIILLETSCQLMREFPPQRSKLGISLELKFPCSSPDSALPDEKNSWSCTSHFYQRGKLEKVFQCNECHSLGPGRVKPPFESKWWAEMFSGLTEKRMRAQDSKNDAAVAIADETARNYLHSLTIMQQISGRQRYSQFPAHSWDFPTNNHQQMAVLLWSFAQASDKLVGTTTWRKLLLPPSRAEINSPLPSAAQLSLPPLSMNATMDVSSDEHMFDLNHDFPSAPLASNIYQGHVLGNPYSDEFMATGSQDGCEFGNVRYENAPHVADLNTDLPPVLDLQFNTQLPQQPRLSDLGFPAQAMGCTRSTLSNQNLEACQPQHEPYYGYGIQHMNVLHQQQDTYNHRLPLMTFDMNTHRELQVQLQRTQKNVEQDAEDGTRASLQHVQQSSQASTDLIGNLLSQTACNNEPGPESDRQGEALKLRRATNNQALETDAFVGTGPVLLAPTAIRPPLLHHHSHADLTQFNLEQNSSTIDASQHSLALLLENLEAKYRQIAAGVQSPSSPGATHGLEIMRPHTQPPPVAELMKEPMYDDVDSAYTTPQPPLDNDSIDCKLEAALTQ